MQLAESQALVSSMKKEMNEILVQKGTCMYIKYYTCHHFNIYRGIREEALN